MDPKRLQRIESVTIGIAVVIAFVAFGYSWWWLLALFLAFDISVVGYVFGPYVGGLTYNLAHCYAVPALLSVIWSIQLAAGHESQVLGIITGAWIFHIAVDRALGYGLKYPDSFNSTHLGRIGRRND